MEKTARPTHAPPPSSPPAAPDPERGRDAPPRRRPSLAALMAGLRGNGSSGLVERYALVGVWAVVIGLYAVIEPSTFLTSGTFQTIFGSQQALVFLSMAAVVVFAVGEFDLSIAAVFGLGATIVPVLVVQHGWSPGAASLVAVAACAAVGLVNGLVIVGIGIDPIVTTLGMSTLLLGLTSGFSGSAAVSGLSASFAKIASTPVVLGLPTSFFYGLALALAIAYVMRFTSLGRHMAFVGANREVARLAGVRVWRIRVGAYVASGVICGVGGVLLTASVGGYDPNSSPTYLLPALSATVLGTAVIKPGWFNPLGALVAIYFLVTGIVGLQLLGYPGWVSDVFYGAALMVAIVISTLTRRRALRTQ